MKERLQEIKKLEQLIQDSKKEKDRLRIKLFHDLQIRFSGLKLRKGRFSYNPSESDQSRIHSEIKLAFRSLVKSTKIQTVSCTSPSYNCKELYLTAKYGLKVPRDWRGIDILGWDRYKEDKVIIEPSGCLLIKNKAGDKLSELCLDQLTNRKGIHQEKFKKLLIFLSRAFKLKAKFNQLRLFEETNNVVGQLKDLTDWSDTEDFEYIIKNLNLFQSQYNSYFAQKKKMIKQLKRLEEDLKEFNKPFKLLLELKKH